MFCCYVKINTLIRNAVTSW